jgi:hypothetical protein
MEKPSPAPTRSNKRDMAAATSAPATIGPQLTAEEDDSDGASTITVSGMAIDISYRHRSMMRMMTGIGTPRSQSRIPRPIVTSCDIYYFKRDSGEVLLLGRGIARTAV